MNVSMNKNGYDSIGEVMTRGTTALSLEEFIDLYEQNDVLVLDTRKASVFASGFIPGSVFVGLEGQFAPWVGAVIPADHQKIILITEVGKEEETVKRLARVGYDHVLGYLNGGYETWVNANQNGDTIGRISVADFSELDWSKECVREEDWGFGKERGVAIRACLRVEHEAIVLRECVYAKEKGWGKVRLLLRRR